MVSESKIIFASGGLGRLQMVSGSDTKRCIDENVRWL